MTNKALEEAANNPALDGWKLVPVEPDDAMIEAVRAVSSANGFGFSSRACLSLGDFCLYWPKENKGFLGLASIGPLKGSRVGPAADVELRGVTCVAECTPEAVQAWEAAPWR